jgi:ATP-dependent Lon protease
VNWLTFYEYWAAIRKEPDSFRPVRRYTVAMNAEDAASTGELEAERDAPAVEPEGSGDSALEPPAEEEELPVLTVRETVIFPGAMLPITVGRPSSLALVQSMGENRLLAVVAQLDPRVEKPRPEDLYPSGTVCVLHKALRVPKENLLLFCEGIGRLRTREFTAMEPFLRARIERVPDIEPPITPEIEALKQNVTNLFQQIVAASPNLSDDLASTANQIAEPGRLADFVAGNVPGLSPSERQILLDMADGGKRLNEVHRFLTRELELIELRGRIQSQVQGQLSQSQREFYLREQLKAIQKELGEGDDASRETDELRKKLDAAGMTEEVKTEALRELNRLSRMSPASPEYGVARSYLEWMAALPWSTSTGSSVDVLRAAEILDEDHYDLEKVKDRILDYLAVLQLRPVLKGPILCFVGPPGVGKTSLGKSIARALGRKFARISMGGMHDEAEIRGHRRTYIGALPGQIIQGLRRAGVNDPVFMLDEVDKLGRDMRGDPASALLEVLDPEQNSTFRDNYLDVPFDLSKVLFITTANVLDTVPDALRNRMEIIPLEGYTEQEKVMIAFRYLIPRQMRENGVDPETGFHFTDESVRFLIRSYTREAGVRSLEREIGAICRKQARRIAEGKTETHEVTPEIVEKDIGAPRFRADAEVAERTRRPGVAVGLAWTPVGGDVLFIEAGRMPGGSRGLIMTGQLGPVMQESVQAALTWVRANAIRYGIDPELFKNTDIHIHVPAGAIPKDGPSAGITMAAALLSMLTERRVRPNLAMTGEITLTGQVLPVGGIKEKVLAAKRSGVREVILPLENEVNVREDLKSEQIGDIQIHYVKSMEEASDLALEK